MDKCPYCFSPLGTWRNDPIKFPEAPVGLNGITFIQGQDIQDLIDRLRQLELELGFAISEKTNFPNFSGPGPHIITKDVIQQLRWCIELILTKSGMEKWEYFNFDYGGIRVLRSDGRQQSDWTDPDLNLYTGNIHYIHIEELRKALYPGLIERFIITPIAKYNEGTALIETDYGGALVPTNAIKETLYQSLPNNDTLSRGWTCSHKFKFESYHTGKEGYYFPSNSPDYLLFMGKRYLFQEIVVTKYFGPPVGYPGGDKWRLGVLLPGPHYGVNSVYLVTGATHNGNSGYTFGGCAWNETPGTPLGWWIPIGWNVGWEQPPEPTIATITYYYRQTFVEPNVTVSGEYLEEARAIPKDFHIIASGNSTGRGWEGSEAGQSTSVDFLFEPIAVPLYNWIVKSNLTMVLGIEQIVTKSANSFSSNMTIEVDFFSVTRGTIRKIYIKVNETSHTAYYYGYPFTQNFIFDFPDLSKDWTIPIGEFYLNCHVGVMPTDETLQSLYIKSNFDAWDDQPSVFDQYTYSTSVSSFDFKINKISFYPLSKVLKS